MRANAKNSRRPDDRIRRRKWRRQILAFQGSVSPKILVRLAQLGSSGAEASGGTFSERAVILIDSYVRSLMENIGVCERIQETPMPFAYVVHLRRASIICSRIDQNLTSVLKPTPAANRSALTQDEKRRRVS